MRHFLSPIRFRVFCGLVQLMASCGIWTLLPTIFSVTNLLGVIRKREFSKLDSQLYSYKGAPKVGSAMPYAEDFFVGTWTHSACRNGNCGFRNSVMKFQKMRACVMNIRSISEDPERSGRSGGGGALVKEKPRWCTALVLLRSSWRSMPK